jgi:predicted transcriptional regulator of viral defense system
MKQDIIKIFEENGGFIQSKQLKNRTYWRVLGKMIEDNSVSKVKRGLYQLNGFIFDMQPMEVSKIIPCGVFCLFTAYRFYELSTYIPFEFHIAVPQKKKINKPDYPPIRVYYLTEKIYQLGITEVEMNGSKVKMYDLEKSVCDVVKFRNKVGLDTTIEVLKNYVKRPDKDLNKLAQYARKLRIENTINNLIMILL